MKKIEIYQTISGTASIISLILFILSHFGIIKPVSIYSYSITGTTKVEVSLSPIFIFLFFILLSLTLMIKRK